MVLHVKPVDQAGQARVGNGVHAPVQQVHQIPGAHGREPHLQRVLQRHHPRVRGANDVSAAQLSSRLGSIDRG